MKNIFVLTTLCFLCPFYALADQKTGRFFEDQKDINDDYQIHFIYLLAKDGVDREWDINGNIESLVLDINEKMLLATSRNKANKKSGGPSKKYKFDYRNDGSVDISFLRMNKSRTQIASTSKGGPMADFDDFLFLKNFNNPKKIYLIFAEMGAKSGEGDAGVGLGAIYLKGFDEISDRLKRLTAHELIHTQGMGYECIKGVKNAHFTGDGNHMLQWGFNFNKKLYIHNQKDCPQMVDSVFLTPTSDDPYDPYEITCLWNIGKYTNKKFLKVIKSKIKRRDKNQSYKPKPRFGSDCRWRDYSRDSEGHYLVGSNINQLDKL